MYTLISIGIFVIGIIIYCCLNRYIRSGEIIILVGIAMLVEILWLKATGQSCPWGLAIWPPVLVIISGICSFHQEITESKDKESKD
jgi:hypothetical protein